MTACGELRSAYYEEVSAAKAINVSGRFGGAVLDNVFDRTVGSMLGGAGNPFTSEIQIQLRESLSELGSSVRESAQRTQQFNTAFNSVYDCRVAEARRVNQLRSDGSISRQEAEQQMALIRTLTQEDVAAARDAQRQIQERQEEFRVAARRARAAAQEAPPEQRPELEQEVAEVEDQITTNQRVYQAAAEDVGKAETQVASSGGPFVVSSAEQRRSIVPA